MSVSLLSQLSIVLVLSDKSEVIALPTNCKLTAFIAEAQINSIDGSCLSSHSFVVHLSLQASTFSRAYTTFIKSSAKMQYALAVGLLLLVVILLSFFHFLSTEKKYSSIL